MKTITIITPANIEVEYRLAGAGSRLAAFAIDLLLQAAAIALVIAIILLGFDRVIFYNINEPSGTALAIVLVSLFLIHFGYFILCELLMNGQTVGKRIFGLRAIRDNGQPVEFIQILIRGVFRTSVDMLYVGIFVVMFSSKHKRIGDMAAGTVVVSEHYEQTYDFTPAKIEHELPDFLVPYADTMSLDERHIVDEWLRRRERLPDKGAAIGKRLEEYLRTHKSRSL